MLVRTQLLLVCGILGQDALFPFAFLHLGVITGSCKSDNHKLDTPRLLTLYWEWSQDYASNNKLSILDCAHWCQQCVHVDAFASIVLCTNGHIRTSKLPKDASIFILQSNAIHVIHRNRLRLAACTGIKSTGASVADSMKQKWCRYILGNGINCWSVLILWWRAHWITNIYLLVMSMGIFFHNRQHPF